MPLPPNKPNPLDGSDYPLSPELEKEREKSEIPVHGRHMVIRIIAFLLLLGTGITFITLSILGFFSSEAGMVKITVTEEEGYRAGDGIECFYYLAGSTRDVNGKSAEIGRIYSQAMKDGYRMTEDELIFDGCHSIGYVNAHPNEDLKIEPRLYKLLEDAASYQDRGLLYQGPLYNDWHKFMGKDAAMVEKNDPAVNAIEKEYIASYLPYLNSASHVSLSFLPDSTVRLNLSQEVLNWKQENEYDGPFLTLGLMRNAYRLQYAADALIEKGYHDGMLVSDDGMLVSLGGLKGMTSNVLAFDQDLGQFVGSLSVAPEESVSLVRHVPVVAKDTQAYVLKANDTTYLRSLHLSPVTGEGYEFVSTLTVKAKGLTPTKLRYQSLKLASATSKEELATYKAETNLSPIYCLKGENKTIHVPEAVKQDITFAEGMGYQVVND